MIIKVHEFGKNTKHDRRIVKIYRKVFGTKLGIIVLAHMLTELGFFSTIPPLDDIKAAWIDYARRLLRLCGIWNDDYKLHILEIGKQIGGTSFNPVEYIKRIFRLGLRSGSEGNPKMTNRG